MKSHVIPEFYWTPLYDEKHQVSSKSASHGYQGKLRKGIRERLLCKTCEQRLARHEEYVARLWYGSRPFPKRLQVGGATRRLIEYTPFKLLHLSILWRAHESSSAGFEDVEFPGYSEELRLHLLDGLAPRAALFPIAAQAIVNPLNNRVMHDMIAPPAEHLMEGHLVYASIYGGCVWYVGVSHGALRGDEYVLQENGHLTVPAISLESLPGIGQLMLAQ